MSIDTYPPLDIIAQPSAVGAMLWRSTVQSTTSGTETIVSFDQAVFDSDNMRDPANPTRLYTRTPGKWVFSAVVEVASGAGRYAYIRKNGTTLVAITTYKEDWGNTDHWNLFTPPIEMAAGDYVEVGIYQDSGGLRDINTSAGGGGSPRKPVLAGFLVSGNANGVPSGARVYRTTDVAHPTSGAYFEIPWQAAETDTDGLWNSGTPSRLYARKTGWYAASGSAFFQSNSLGSHRIFRIVKNATDPLGEAMSPFGANIGPRGNPSAIVFLRAGDFLTLEAYQDAVNGLLIEAGSGEGCELSMVCITGTTVSTRDAPYFDVLRIGTLALASSTWTEVPLNTPKVDTDLQLANGRFTCRVPGRYLFTASLYDGTAGTQLNLGLRKNGTIWVSQSNSHASGGLPPHQETTGFVDLIPGDTVSMWAHTSAAATVGSDQADVYPYAAHMQAVLIAPISQAAIMAPEAYREVGASGQPAFTNSWTNYGAGYNTAAFYKDPMGRVHLRGLIKNGNTTLPFFTLPIGYRPASFELFDGISNDGHCRINVEPDGDIAPGAGVSATWVCLDGLSFRAA